MKADPPGLRGICPGMAVMSIRYRQPGALWFAGFEGLEDLGADGPRAGAPGTLGRRRSCSQRCDDRRLGI